MDWWAEKDSNLRSLPTTDLQSVPIGHSGTCPILCQATHDTRFPGREEGRKGVGE